jgi:hypothetical protein
MAGGEIRPGRGDSEDRGTETVDITWYPSEQPSSSWPSGSCFSFGPGGPELPPHRASCLIQDLVARGGEVSAVSVLSHMPGRGVMGACTFSSFV